MSIPFLMVTFSAAFFATTACGDEPIRQSHDWGQPLKDFHTHTYLSEVGQPSAAPDSPSETWVQHLSGTDKDNTVDWDFYVTWSKMQQWCHLPVPSCWEMHGFGRLTYGDVERTQPQLDTIQQPKNVHFNNEGNRLLAEQVAKAIEEELNARR